MTDSTELLRPYWRDRYETYPVLLSRSLSNGFELLVVRISTKSLLSAISEGPEKFKEIACQCWLPPPTPIPEDIVHMKTLERHGDQTDISFTLKRGHYQLSEILRSHETVTFSADLVRCTCHPDRSWNINLFSLTGLEFDAKDQSPD